MKPVFYLLLTCVVLAACQNSNHNSSGSSDSAHEGMNHDSEVDNESKMMLAMSKGMEAMHAVKLTGNADVDLSKMMAKHHKSAIAMAQEELDEGNDAQLKEMSNAIIKKQQAEIEQLNAIIHDLKAAKPDYDPNNKNAGLGSALNKNMMRMMQMGEMSKSSVDHEFASMMKKHHQDGVDMARLMVEFGHDARVKQLGNAIIKDQEAEISVFERWLEAHK